MATGATSSPPPRDELISAPLPRQAAPPAEPQQPANDVSATYELIAGRYHVVEELGRGGMATVYRVLDGATDRHLALKRLHADGDTGKRAAAEALFEAEFQTLSQLQHPRVIQVFDYGVADGRAYYTMELLDGGDLSELSPLPWREACALIYDVCSSLALLHSRRLVHRDVSPRNIRRTRDGRPKLIDFGAMASMGPCSQAVGTPAFVAPEVAQRASLDGRTDLFSLGATLYYALVGRPPYPARNFSQLHEVWATKPTPASAYVSDIPAALDHLVLSMVSLEPALRPRSAFDVMQRLAAIANLEQAESLGVSRAYLAIPSLIGRDELLAKLRRRATRAEGGVGSALLIEGAPGSGRTRALDASVLQLKTSGVITLRAGGVTAGRRPFALAHSLAQQLLASLPEASLEAARAESVDDLLLVAVNDSDGVTKRFEIAPLEGDGDGPERARLLDAFQKWFLRVARTNTLAIAADDVDRADDASMALLTALADRSRRHRLLLVTSAIRTPAGDSGALALHALRERSSSVPLSSLTPAQTAAMFDSVFGDVPHVALLSDRIHRVALGNPRMSMELAQHLTNQGAIRYDAGTWTLPSELEQAALPSSLEAAFTERIAALSPLARSIAECHALCAYRELTRDDHKVLLGDATVEATNHALQELLEREVLTADGQLLSLAQPAFVPLLLSVLPESEQLDLHRALGELGERAGKPELPTIHHLLCGGLHERALDRVASALEGQVAALEHALRAQLSPRPACELMERALSYAEQTGRPARMCAELRHWICLISVNSDDEDFYLRNAPELLAVLKRDSGFDDWHALASTADPGQRLMAALTAASQRHAALAPELRAFPADEAIKRLVLFVAISIAFGVRMVDVRLLKSLPGLLEPFAPLSPIIDAIQQNAIATCETSVEARYFQARERWLGVMERLSNVQGDALQHVDQIRCAVGFALGCLEGGRGFPTAEKWAQQLEAEPQQQVSAMYLRKVARLQLGDWEGAERCRRAAELLALQASTPPMFGSQIIELSAHAMASDLPGVQQCAARIDTLARRHKGWQPWSLLAKGYFDLLRGDPEAARTVLERALVECAPDSRDPDRSLMAWPSVAGAYVQALVNSGRVEEARSFGERALADGERLGIRTLDDVVRGLALAETKLGAYPQACARLQVLIDRQLSLGVTGLHLGASYEARARIAILANDQPAVEIYGRLTADQYRHGRGSPLGVRYEALMSEARRAGVVVLPALSDFEIHTIGLTEMRGITSSAFVVVTSALRTVHDPEQRSQKALRLICDAYSADGGHLYLVRSSDNLERTASQGPHVAGDAQYGLARRCLDNALNHEDMATEMVSGTTGLGAGVAVIWTEDGSIEYRTMVISARVDGVIKHAGAVVLTASANKPKPEALATLSAVGKLLLELGDSTGIIAM
jgi:hypothetical protein